MIEALVIAACIGDYRCDEASKAYLSTNPPAKVWAMQKSRKFRRYVGNQTIVGATIIYSILTNRTYQVKLGKNISYGRMPEGNMLFYAIEF